MSRSIRDILRKAISLSQRLTFQHQNSTQTVSPDWSQYPVSLPLLPTARLLRCYTAKFVLRLESFVDRLLTITQSEL
uniref:Uncharacterized protein n=1 Tax=Heterorhabditis bacteriophora TaxID=37862 RepID=A0A1I7WGB8_HETBA